jgi:hypothetical protein
MLKSLRQEAGTSAQAAVVHYFESGSVTAVAAHTDRSESLAAQWHMAIMIMIRQRGRRRSGAASFMSL